MMAPKLILCLPEKAKLIKNFSNMLLVGYFQNILASYKVTHVPKSKKTEQEGGGRRRNVYMKFIFICMYIYVHGWI